MNALSGLVKHACLPLPIRLIIFGRGVEEAKGKILEDNIQRVEVGGGDVFIRVSERLHPSILALEMSHWTLAIAS